MFKINHDLDNYRRLYSPWSTNGLTAQFWHNEINKSK